MDPFLLFVFVSYLSFVLLSCLFLAALWSPAGKVLTSWLFSVMFFLYDYNTTTIQMGFRRKSNDLSQAFTLLICVLSCGNCHLCSHTVAVKGIGGSTGK